MHAKNYCYELPPQPIVHYDEPLCHCAECEEPLYDGDEVYDAGGIIVCSLCESAFHQQHRRVLWA